MITLLFASTLICDCKDESSVSMQYKIPLRPELARAIEGIQTETNYSLYEILMANGYGLNRCCLNIVNPEEDVYVLEFCSTNLSAQALIMWIVQVSYYDSEQKTIRHKEVTVAELKELLQKGIEASKYEIERERSLDKKLRILRGNHSFAFPNK